MVFHKLAKAIQWKKDLFNNGLDSLGKIQQPYAKNKNELWPKPPTL